MRSMPNHSNASPLVQACGACRHAHGNRGVWSRWGPVVMATTMALGTVVAITAPARVAGAVGGDVCVAARGRQVRGDPTVCDADHTSVAVAVRISQADAYDGSRAIAVDGSLALAMDGSRTTAVHGSSTLAVSGSQATAVNDSGATAIGGSRGLAVNDSSALAVDHGAATGVNAADVDATGCRATAVNDTGTC